MEREIAPHVASMDRENKYPFELLKKLGENNYIGIRFPRAYGGAGRDLVSETLCY